MVRHLLLHRRHAALPFIRAMIRDRYRTISAPVEGTYRELASKFIARAFPIGDEAEFKRLAAAFGNEHPSSRHVCYAWILGTNGDHHRANDDGEPSGTAGLPILRRIRSLDLTYCGVAVVRYFGGTLLGKPGLIHAYGEAARLALEAAEILERVVMERWSLRCGYDRFDGVKAEVLACGGRLVDPVFAVDCTATIELPLGQGAMLRPKWELLGVDVEPINS